MIIFKEPCPHICLNSSEVRSLAENHKWPIREVLPIRRNGDVRGPGNFGDGGIHNIPALKSQATKVTQERKNKHLGICHSGALVPDDRVTGDTHCFLLPCPLSTLYIQVQHREWERRCGRVRWKNQKLPMPTMGFQASVQPKPEEAVQLRY